MNDLKENEDYIFDISEDTPGSISVKLISGDFSGVVYNYGKVMGEEDEERGEFYLRFEYDVKDSNGLENLENDVRFKDYIGNVLSSIISNKTGNFEETVEETEYYEIGTDDN